MKPAISTRGPGARLGLIAFLAAMVALPVARSQDTPHTQGAIPLIVMDDVPLRDAIRNLARQAGQNYIFDPRLDGPWVAPDGRSGREPSVSIRWENLTAAQALGRLLKDHGLAMVANPAASIARIAFTNQVVKPLPAGAVAGGTNAVIPLVIMDSVPLPDAIRHLAGKAQLRLALDPSMPVPSSGPGRRTLAEYEVSVRWENVTAQQALAALLDNYDLGLVEDPTTASAKIMARAQTQAGKPPKER